jgi:hypothetical protein
MINLAKTAESLESVQLASYYDSLPAEALSAKWAA